MPSWPASLPQHVLVQGYSERRIPNVIESQMDAGPAKARRRFTAQIDRFSVSLEMTQTQAETFRVFYEDACASGSLPFDWVHPRARTALTLRFRQPPPIYRSRGGEIMRVSFVMESVA